MEHANIVNELIIILGASVAAAAVFTRLQVPTIICYLFVGLILGPNGLGLVKGVAEFQIIAEFGVAFLLFTLGLEFSLPHLIALRKVVFGLGSLQVAICIAVFGGLIYLARSVYAISMTGTLIAASAVALSSTAIVSKELSQRNEIATAHGHTAIGILLFQDIAAIVILVLISVGSDASGEELILSLAFAGAKAIGFFVCMVAIGKWIMPPLFTEISKTKSEELFVLTVLVVALLSAATAHSLGLAMALGAFMAGMMLGESHFRHQIEAEIRPFRDVLLGIFFVSIGLMIDFDLIQTFWPRILFFSACLIVFKTILIGLLCKTFGNSPIVSFRTGLILCQGGEFGFALLALAVKGDLVPTDVASFFLSIIVISMGVTPLLVSNSEKIANYFLARQRQNPADTLLPDTTSHSASEMEGHVILCGYGRVGQTIARFLQQEQIPYIAIDDDPVRVQRARLAGENVEYGSARKLKVLMHLGLMKANLMVISFDDHIAAKKMLLEVRQQRAKLPILVRTRDDAHLLELQEAGATAVIPETLEASLMLVGHVMVALGQPGEKVFESIDNVRNERYKMLHGFIVGQHGPYGMSRYKRRLHPVFLPASAFAVNKAVGNLELEPLNVKLHTIRRGNDIVLDANENTLLLESDIVVLSGEQTDIEAAEAYLLSGKSLLTSN
ncbi:MAG: cation:proton antiporter [Ketobacter sp.]